MQVDLHQVPGNGAYPDGCIKNTKMDKAQEGVPDKSGREEQARG
jgi:hypothetical protein